MGDHVPEVPFAARTGSRVVGDDNEGGSEDQSRETNLIGISRHVTTLAALIDDILATIDGVSSWWAIESGKFSEDIEAYDSREEEKKKNAQQQRKRAFPINNLKDRLRRVAAWVGSKNTDNGNMKLHQQNILSTVEALAKVKMLTMIADNGAQLHTSVIPLQLLSKTTMGLPTTHTLQAYQITGPRSKQATRTTSQRIIPSPSPGLFTSSIPRRPLLDNILQRIDLILFPTCPIQSSAGSGSIAYKFGFWVQDCSLRFHDALLSSNPSPPPPRLAMCGRKSLEAIDRNTHPNSCLPA